VNDDRKYTRIQPTINGENRTMKNLGYESEPAKKYK
jgi:hypothetical protein